MSACSQHHKPTHQPNTKFPILYSHTYQTQLNLNPEPRSSVRVGAIRMKSTQSQNLRTICQALETAPKVYWFLSVFSDN